MTSVFILSVFLIASLFKVNNALMSFPQISNTPLKIPTSNTQYCRLIITYMEMECFPYFTDHSSYPDNRCCFAFESIAANDTNCIRDDTIESDNLSMDVANVMKIPNIYYGVSLPCHVKSLISSSISIVIG
jgi:hypothetical protein